MCCHLAVGGQGVEVAEEGHVHLEVEDGQEAPQAGVKDAGKKYRKNALGTRENGRCVGLG